MKKTVVIVPSFASALMSKGSLYSLQIISDFPSPMIREGLTSQSGFSRSLSSTRSQHSFIKFRSYIDFSAQRSNMAVELARLQK